MKFSPAQLRREIRMQQRIIATQIVNDEYDPAAHRKLRNLESDLSVCLMNRIAERRNNERNNA